MAGFLAELFGTLVGAGVDAAIPRRMTAVFIRLTMFIVAIFLAALGGLIAYDVALGIEKPIVGLAAAAFLGIAIYALKLGFKGFRSSSSARQAES